MTWVVSWPEEHIASVDYIYAGLDIHITHGEFSLWRWQIEIGEYSSEKAVSDIKPHFEANRNSMQNTFCSQEN